jgi:hypothetical protein
VRSPLVRSVVASQVALFAFLAVCIAIEPAYLFRRNEGGLSNFGVHAATVVPYTLAFLLCAIFLGRAASLVTVVDPTTRAFRTMLLVLACLLVAVLGSTYPYKTSQLLHGVHIAVGVVTVCFESAASIWIALAVAKDRWSLAALCAQLVGLLLAALTFFGQLHVLFAAQLLTSLAFGVLLVRGARVVDASRVASS